MGEQIFFFVVSYHEITSVVIKFIYKSLQLKLFRTLILPFDYKINFNRAEGIVVTVFGHEM